MDQVELVGFIGTVVLSLTLIPQVVHSIKKSDASGVSYGFLGLQIISNIIFIVYGVLLKSDGYPIIASNCCVLLNSMIILCIKLKYSLVDTHTDNPDIYERLNLSQIRTV